MSLQIFNDSVHFKSNIIIKGALLVVVTPKNVFVVTSHFHLSAYYCCEIIFHYGISSSSGCMSLIILRPVSFEACHDD